MFRGCHLEPSVFVIFIFFVLLSPVYDSELFPAQWLTLSLLLLAVLIFLPSSPEQSPALVHPRVLLQVSLLQPVLVLVKELLLPDDHGLAQPLELSDALLEQVLQPQPLVLVLERGIL